MTSTTRLDQLPGQPSDLAAKVAALQRQIDELRARQADLSAADALLPPLDTDTSRWPQTTNGSYTAIARSVSIWHGTQLRLALVTSASGGSTGNVRVTINGTQWGTAVSAGSAFDNTATIPGVNVGDQIEIVIEAQRLTGAGAISAQTRLIRSII